MTSNTTTLEGPKLGCVALISDETHRILLIRWGNGPQSGQWGLPGGMAKKRCPAVLSIVNDIDRILGVLIWPHRIVAICDDIDEARQSHHVSIVYCAAVLAGQPLIGDPTTVRQFGWFCRTELPQPLTRATIDALRTHDCVPVHFP